MMRPGPSWATKLHSPSERPCPAAYRPSHYNHLKKTARRKRSINIHHAIAEGEHECLQSRVHPEFGQDTCHVVTRCL